MEKSPYFFKEKGEITPLRRDRRNHKIFSGKGRFKFLFHPVIYHIILCQRTKNQASTTKRQSDN